MAKNSLRQNDPTSWRELQKYTYWIAFSILPVSAAYLCSAVLSGSRSVAAMTCFCLVSVFFNVFAVLSMRAIVRQNVFVFPYGAGKLENFIAFLTGVLMLPAAVLIYVSTVGAFVGGNHAVRFGFAQVGLLPGLLRDFWLLLWSCRLLRNAPSPSPIVQSYYVSYQVSVTITLTGILSLLFALWLAGMGRGALGARIDLGLAFLLATYMAISAILLVRKNFRVLIDLPLPEGDQLKILGVLTRHCDAYGNLGAVCTRTCGSTKIIEIELHFPGAASLESIQALAEAFRADLAAVFDDFDFRLIPVLDASVRVAGDRPPGPPPAAGPEAGA